jgi:predicted Zn finger-like uncharacterized protein
MILICPNCAKRYRLPAGSIGPGGRKVRCRACGHAWHATPVETAPPAPPAADDKTAPAADPLAVALPVSTRQPQVEPAPLPPPMTAAAGRRRDRAVGAVAWLSLLLLVLVGAALYLGRHQVVEALPMLAPYYEKVGIPVTLRSGLELRNLTSSRVEEQGRSVLVVAGEIHNTADQERTLPRVRVALLDDSRAEIEFGLFDADARTLAPGASTRFEARLLDPPAAAKTYAVSLADSL